MKKKYLLILASFAMVLSFQNCGKTPLSEDLRDSNNPNMQKVDIENKDVALWDVARGQILDVDLQSGAMAASSILGAPLNEVYCLSDEEKQELHEIINSSQVCIPEEEVLNSETVCTMEYKYPYASLKEGSQIWFNLGETRSGCEEAVDLCDQSGAALRAFSKRILENLANHQCE